MHVVEHPEFRGTFGDWQEQMGGGYGDLAPGQLAGDRLARAGERGDLKRLADGSARVGIEPPRPEIEQAVSIREKVQRAAVGRPVWLVVVPAALRQWLPGATRCGHDIVA